MGARPRCSFETELKQIRADIACYIVCFYNCERLHSALVYLSHNNFERRALMAACAAKSPIVVSIKLDHEGHRGSSVRLSVPGPNLRDQLLADSTRPDQRITALGNMFTRDLISDYSALLL